jgi:hypothetical protein
MSTDNSTVARDLTPDTAISVRDAFLAMRMYLFRFWDRDGRPDDQIQYMLSNSNLRVWKQDASEPLTADPAYWPDWIDAVQDALAGSTPEDLLAQQAQQELNIDGR